jgi:C4-dicarboxylate-binding protein DctP
MSKPVTIRWVIAHDPEYLFLRAAEYFRDELEKRVPGQIELDIYTVADYAEEHGNERNITKKEVMNLLESGEIQISQIYTNWVADRWAPDWKVLDLPFLFRDHEHSTRVFEGEVGKNLLDGVEKDSENKVKALSFTYSGGYKVVPSDRSIENIEDFKDMKIKRVLGNPAEDLFDMLGSEHVYFPIDEIQDNMKSTGKVNATESTYTRYFPLGQDDYFPYILDIEYGLASTSILINKPFWDTLTVEQQLAIKEAGEIAARIERQESIDDAEMIKQQCNEKGTTIIRWTEEEIDRFKKMTMPIVDKYEQVVGKGIVDKIRKS